MYCPICDQKPMNCDCTEAERRMHCEIEELQEHAPRWIPVSERLPEPFVPVLVWFASPVTRKLKYAEVTHRGVAGDWQHSHQFDKPSHWMPLPEPPNDPTAVR